MSRDYVIINGKNSLTITGLAIKTLPPISKPLMRTMREEIDGRDGDINTELGYQAYDKPLEVGLFGSYDINEIIAFFNSKGTIVFSDEPDKFYNFEILDKIDFTRLVKFRSAIVNIHCQPFKYPLTDTPVDVAYEYVESTGENLTLDNTEASSLGLELKGNTSQVQYTGENLCSNAIYFNENAIYLYFNPKALPKTFTISLIAPKTLANVGVYAWCDGTNLGRKTYIQFTANQRVYITYTLNDNDYNTMQNGSSAFFSLYYSGASFDTTKVVEQPQIETGSSMTSYEPYVGGIASPNPSYPQPVNVVSGDNEININGKNLFTTGNGSSTRIGVNATYNESEVILNGTTTGAGNIFYDETISINTGYRKSQTLPAGTYTLSVKTTGTATYPSGIGIAIYIRDGNGNILKSFSSIANYQTTLTLNNETEIYSQFYVNGSGGVYNNYSIYFQIEKGSTATTYEPYIGNTYPINLPVENLFNTSSSIWYSANSSASYDSTNDTFTFHRDSGADYLIKGGELKLEPNSTYTITFDVIENTMTNPLTNVTSNSSFVNGSISIPANTTGEYTFTITTRSASTYTYDLWLYCSSTGTLKTKIMLEKGSKANHYTPYGTTPIELCKIGTYQDYIYKDNGSWYLHKEIGKVVLDGSENWRHQSAYDLTNTSQFAYLQAIEPLTNYLGYSNYFTRTTGWATLTTTDDNMFQLYQDKTIYIRINKTLVSDLATFKTWLSTHNTIVYYVLATPTTTEITDTTLIEQLNAIQNAVSYSGQTNITQENSDKPFMIDATALKKGSDTAVLNNIGNIYSKPVITLQGTGIVNIYNDGVQAFQVDMSEENDITIDTEMMEAYTPTKLANRQVTGDYSKFMIDTGSHNVKFDGELTEATITRYVRWL